MITLKLAVISIRIMANLYANVFCCSNKEWASFGLVALGIQEALSETISDTCSIDTDSNFEVWEKVLEIVTYI